MSPRPRCEGSGIRIGERRTLFKVDKTIVNQAGRAVIDQVTKRIPVWIGITFSDLLSTVRCSRLGRCDIYATGHRRLTREGCVWQRTGTETIDIVLADPLQN